MSNRHRAIGILRAGLHAPIVDPGRFFELPTEQAPVVEVGQIGRVLGVNLKVGCGTRHRAGAKVPVVRS
jgi:hypothetical protein